MALSPKKIIKSFEKQNKESKYFLTGSVITELSSSYVGATHIESSDWFYDQGNQSILYQLQLLEEEIDEIRRFVTGSGELNVNCGSF